MKATLRILICYLTVLVSCYSANGQSSLYNNFSFELGNFTNWEGYTWQYESRIDEPTSEPIKGFVERRHEIISDTNAYDRNTGNLLKLIPPGYKYSVRLGDSIRTSDDTIRNWRQSLQYNMTVDSANPLITIMFALVLENFMLHDLHSEQHFSFSILDENKNIIQSCANFDIYPSANQFSDFNTYYPINHQNPARPSTIGWKDWTTIIADLSDFIGQTITLEFLAEDCILPEPELHPFWNTCFGYAYIATSCEPVKLKQKNCTNNSEPNLIAPDGFETYVWTNENNEEIGYSQTLEIRNLQKDSDYFCSMTTVFGCETIGKIRPNTTIFMPQANFSSDHSCDSNIVQFFNSSITTGGDLSYLWDFGNGITSSDSNPRYVYSNSGVHEVTLHVINSISRCTDHLTKTVESFSPQSIAILGNNTYCPGESIWIKGHGSLEYQWSNGLKTDSIEIGAPGGDFWLVGTSSDNICTSDTVYTSVTEEEDWPFWIEGDTLLCQGEETTLSIYGSENHYWSDGTSLSELIVSDSGTYSCIGQNRHGCLKTTSINVIISPLPNANFRLSDSIINIKNNEITATAENVSHTNYLWDMGDDQDAKTGSSITHSYDYYIPGKPFICTLEATNEFGCTNYSTKEIIVIPFIPNIFTPNNDGVNDIFMEGTYIEIFDRHGKLYYKGTDGWDGNFNGQPADPDTYFYSISFSFNNIESEIKKGYLTLMR